MTTAGYGVAWNGIILVAVGSGSVSGPNNVAYSTDGITWIASTSGNSILTTAGYGVAWNGIRWVSVGDGTNNTIAYSFDGITWSGAGKTIFTTTGYGVAGNPNVGATIVDSTITLNSNIYPQTNKLDIVSGDYYNSGYTNFSVNILSTTK